MHLCSSDVSLLSKETLDSKSHTVLNARTLIKTLWGSFRPTHLHLFFKRIRLRVFRAQLLVLLRHKFLQSPDAVTEADDAALELLKIRRAVVLDSELEAIWKIRKKRLFAIKICDKREIQKRKRFCKNPMCKNVILLFDQVDRKKRKKERF